MARKVIDNILLGQACLLGGLLMCVVLKPRGLTANDGISYYGTFRLTVAPYAVALLGSTLFIWRALHQVAPALPALAYVRGMASCLAAMSVGVVLTPYSANIAFDWVHTALGTAVFALQLLLAMRLHGWNGGDAWSTGFLMTQFVSGVFCAVFVLPKHGFLIQGQLVFQLSFGALLLRTARLLLPQPAAQVTQVSLDLARCRPWRTSFNT